jgi:hypothetical integral membrane protein (TIGR02206 family)
MSPQFVLFGPSHVIAILLTLALPLAMALAARHEHLGRHADRATRIGLALLLLSGWAGYLLVNGVRGELNLDRSLPMHLCDWAQIALIVALFTRNQFAYELGYFWGLGGTLQGVVTPTVFYDFPDLQFLFFFIQHGGIIAGLLYLTLGSRLRPYPKSLPRVVLASFAYLAAAGLVDWLLGVNYGFLREKPAGQNLLTILSPWPWYIPELVLIGALSVLIYYLPFALVDGIRGRKKPRSASSD